MSSILLFAHVQKVFLDLRDSIRNGLNRTRFLFFAKIKIFDFINAVLQAFNFYEHSLCITMTSLIRFTNSSLRSCFQCQSVGNDTVHGKIECVFMPSILPLTQLFDDWATKCTFTRLLRRKQFGFPISCVIRVILVLRSE